MSINRVVGPGYMKNMVGNSQIDILWW